MRYLPFLFASFALTACGAGSQLDDRFDPGLPVSPLPAGAEAPSYFLAVRNDVTTVVAVHPDTGEIVPFGPALPLPLPTSTNSTLTGYIPSIVYAADGRVIVEGTDTKADGAAIVWVGDGSSWRELASAPSWTDATTTDGTGVVISRGCDEVSGIPSTYSFSVVDVDDSGKYRDATCPIGDSPSAIARGPNGKYLVLNRDNSLFVRSKAGVETAVAGPASAQTQALFDTSFLATWEGHAAWFDADGSPLSVPGTATDPNAFAATFQVSDGVLSSISDRQITRLQAVPSSVTAKSIGAILPGHYAVATTGGPQALVIGLDGKTLETFDPGGPYDVTEVLAAAPSAPWPWVVLASSHFTPTEESDVGTIEALHTLYLPGDPASGKPPRSKKLAHGDLDGLDRAYWPSPSGRFVFYLDYQGTGGLHALEVETQNDIEVGGEYDTVFR